MKERSKHYSNGCCCIMLDYAKETKECVWEYTFEDKNYLWVLGRQVKTIEFQEEEYSDKMYITNMFDINGNDVYGLLKTYYAKYSDYDWCFFMGALDEHIRHDIELKGAHGIKKNNYSTYWNIIIEEIEKFFKEVGEDDYTCNLRLLLDKIVIIGDYMIDTVEVERLWTHGKPALFLYTTDDELVDNVKMWDERYQRELFDIVSEQIARYKYKKPQLYSHQGCLFDSVAYTTFDGKTLVQCTLGNEITYVEDYDKMSDGLKNLLEEKKLYRYLL